MPKVSAERKAERRDQILDAARRCFARNGLHSTSMDDVITESGLSAGALYRYFPGKDALILATLDDTLGTVKGAVASAVHALDGNAAGADTAALEPGALLARLTTMMLATINRGGEDIAHLALHAWAESTRNPQVADLLRERYQTLRAELVHLAAHWVRTGVLAADADPELVAKAVMATVLGFVVQRTVVGGITPETLGAGVTALRSRGAAHP